MRSAAAATSSTSSTSQPVPTTSTAPPNPTTTVTSAAPATTAKPRTATTTAVVKSAPTTTTTTASGFPFGADKAAIRIAQNYRVPVNLVINGVTYYLPSQFGTYGDFMPIVPSPGGTDSVSVTSTIVANPDCVQPVPKRYFVAGHRYDVLISTDVQTGTCPTVTVQETRFRG
ncbi:MAG: hypothetical protein JO087_15185 [Actinobacteria bacterium]|nr:hypothetical protein [Actinomycetota bacterium]